MQVFFSIDAVTSELGDELPKSNGVCVGPVAASGDEDSDDEFDDDFDEEDFDDDFDDDFEEEDDDGYENPFEDNAGNRGHQDGGDCGVELFDD